MINESQSQNTFIEKEYSIKDIYYTIRNNAKGQFRKSAKQKRKKYEMKLNHNPSA